ncbi:G-protein coupled receptor moody-like [Diadema setosum]|uniref:G-protein coupled receptor moody-like n=1 Tax=Diadema setosum TaxID=31175 RepID=UPI003B3B5955
MEPEDYSLRCDNCQGNTSPSPSPTDEEELIIAYSARLVVALIVLVTFVVGLVGNTLVLIAVAVSRKLQTSTNAIVVNLAVADILFCFVIPFQVTNTLSNRGPLLEDKLCAVIGGIAISAANASVITLALIAVNRLVIITAKRSTYRRIFSARNVAIMIALSWLIPLSTKVIPQLAGKGKLGYIKQHGICAMDLTTKYARIYLIITACVQICCFVVVVVAYGLIYTFLRKNFFGKHRMPPTTPSAASIPQLLMSQPTQENQPDNRQNAQVGRELPSKREIQITRNFFWVIFGFFVSFVPYAITVVIPHNRKALFFMNLFLCASNFINPLIYGFNHPHFRVVFRALLRRDFDQITEPAPWLRKLRQS